MEVAEKPLDDPSAFVCSPTRRGFLPDNDSQTCSLLQRLLDSISVEIVLLDDSGTIVCTNAAWKSFASRHELPEEKCGQGVNYLDTCARAASSGCSEAAEVFHGLLRVLKGEIREFCLEYPCHSPSEQRWFQLRARRFSFGGSGWIGMTHEDVTQLKLSEVRLTELNQALEEDNDRLRWRASTDGLTGLPNRLAFDLILADQWRICRQQQQPVSLAMIDIDCFKQYNDSLGHPEGDRCLKRVAAAIEECARRYDAVGTRYGGEEFAVVAPGLSLPEIGEFGRELCRSIRDLSLPHPDSHVASTVTASVGCATDDGNLSAAAKLIKYADRALYRAKDSGRDRVVCWRPRTPS